MFRGFLRKILKLFLSLKMEMWGKYLTCFSIFAYFLMKAPEGGGEGGGGWISCFTSCSKVLILLWQSWLIALLQEGNFENSFPVLGDTTFKPSEKKKSSVKEHHSHIFFLSQNSWLSNVRLSYHLLEKTKQKISNNWLVWTIFIMMVP